MEGIAEEVPGVKIINPGVKSFARAKAKINADYLGDYNKIKDVARAAFVTTKDNDFKSILKIYKKCKETGFATVQTKNSFRQIPNGPNYADLKVIKMVNGVYAEIQFMIKEIHVVK